MVHQLLSLNNVQLLKDFGIFLKIIDIRNNFEYYKEKIVKGSQKTVPVYRTITFISLVQLC